MNRTSIEWADWSVNPIKLRLASGKTVNACTKVSAGCANCYAESITKRWWPKAEQEFPGYRLPLLERGELVLLEHELEAVLRLDERIARGKADAAENKVFWGDMNDLFGEWVPFGMLDLCFAVMALTPRLVHQVLTKRPERMAEYWGRMRCSELNILRAAHRYEGAISGGWSWPLPNVWLGTSVEDQKAADQRIPHLLNCPAAVRFLSCEPLLGPVDLSEWLDPACPDDPDGQHHVGCGCNAADDIHWVIAGGESGPGARPCDVRWIQHLTVQAEAAGVPVFVKQLGRYPLDYNALDWPQGTRFDRGGHPDVADHKGGDMTQWPEVLRIREMPEVSHG